MKAVITQIKGRNAILLTQDGEFLRVSNRGYQLGQQICIAKKRRHPLHSLLSAACICVFLFAATAYAADTLAFSYVSIDVNPSMQMTLNWFDEVLTLEAMNDDAQELVEALTEDDILDESIDDAMQMIYTALQENEYIGDTEDNDVVVAVASYGLKDVSDLTEQLEETQTVETSGIVLNITTVEVDTETLEEAEEYHTTAGKLAIVEPIAGENAEDMEVWLDQSVHDILQASAMEPQEDAESASGEGETPPEISNPSEQDQSEAELEQMNEIAADDTTTFQTLTDMAEETSDTAVENNTTEDAAEENADATEGKTDTPPPIRDENNEEPTVEMQEGDAEGLVPEGELQSDEEPPDEIDSAETQRSGVPSDDPPVPKEDSSPPAEMPSENDSGSE